MNWVKELLIHRDLPIYLLTEYLKNYQDAVYAHLEDDGKPILEWFDNVHLNHKQDGDSK
jgi:hypothetical protein